MMFLVMAAFGNFYYVLNNNSEKTDESHYVGVYTGNEYIDSFFQMYIFAVGEVDLDAERKAKSNPYIGWTLFFSSIYVLQVIFMTLLISII